MAQVVVTDVDKRIGVAIRERRTKLGVTQDGLARQIGVTFQQVQKYERGVNRVSAAALVRVAGALECDPSDLFGEAQPGKLTISEREILKLWADLRPGEQEAVISMVREFLRR